MRVLLLKDVYKLGHAGDVKKVADGYGRNYLLPQRLAVLATPSALKQAETLRQNAAITRAKLNDELKGVADQLKALTLLFPMKAGETGKLYGSITSASIAAKIKELSGLEIDRRNIPAQPIRELGEYKVQVRLTADLISQVKVIVHREGEVVKASAEAASAETAAPASPAPAEVAAPAEAGPAA
jgi:large subunit ribosomal protein L9